RSTSGSASARGQDVPDRKAGVNTRNAGEHRKDVLVDPFEVVGMLDVDPQLIVGITCHQVAFADFRVPAHRCLEASEIVLGLSLQADLDDDRDPFTLRGAPDDGGIAAYNPLLLKDFHPPQA